jgi:hypothetical protein
VTDEALALAFRTGLPFVGLRDHEPDPDLDRIVPSDAARTARALPLAAEDDHIRLAVADPDADLSALNPYLTGRQIDLALAPRDELDTILGPPPVAAEAKQAGEDDEPDGVAPTATDHEHPAELSDEAEPVAADLTAPADGVEPESLAAAPSDDDAEPLAAAATDDEPEPPATAAGDDEAEALAAAATDDEPEPLAAASGDDQAEPLAAARSDESEPAGDSDRGPLWVAGTSQVAHQAELAAIGGETVGVAAAEPGAPVDDHPELAGELPSWLEPPRRGRRVLLTVLIVIVVLAIAAAVLIAFANA